MCRAVVAVAHAYTEKVPSNALRQPSAGDAVARAQQMCWYQRPGSCTQLRACMARHSTGVTGCVMQLLHCWVTRERHTTCVSSTWVVNAMQASIMGNSSRAGPEAPAHKAFTQLTPTAPCCQVVSVLQLQTEPSLCTLGQHKHRSINGGRLDWNNHTNPSYGTPHAGQQATNPPVRSAPVRQTAATTAEFGSHQVAASR